MPRFEFCIERDAFIKVCSCCKEVSVGVKDKEESLRIFQDTFATAGPSSGMADGLQSRCWMCNTRSRRDLGVTRTELQRMHQAQNGKCAICAKDISIVRYAESKTKAEVDHNPDTGEVRELLCGDCNRGIGCLNHDSTRIKSAAAYVDKHNVVPFKRRA